MLTNYKTSKGLAGSFGLFLSACLIFSCSTEELVEPTSLAEIVTPESAVPTTGSIYYIKNKNSGRYMDISNKSNSNGANLQQWGTSASSSDTHRQWEIVDLNNGYVRLKGVDSGKSLEVSAGSNSNGANVQQWAYQGTTHQQWEILSTGSGYYRIKGRDSGKSMGVTSASTSNGANIEQRSWNGDDKFQWLFEEVSGSTGGGSGGGSTPGDLLGLTSSNWKLNGHTGSPSSSTYRDDVIDHLNTSFSNYSDANYFYVDGDYAAFKVYRGQGGSNNSDNPRVELREMNGTNNLAAWSGTGNHTMTWVARVDQLGKDADGSGGTTCFGQIHGDGDTVDDVIRVQFTTSSTNQSSGSVSLKISGFVTENLQGGSKTYSGYSLDTEYTFKLTYISSVVRFYIDGTEVFEQSMSGEDTSNNYWKVGNYMQSVQGASYDGSFSIVKIKSINITD